MRWLMIQTASKMQATGSIFISMLTVGFLMESLRSVRTEPNGCVFMPSRNG